MAKTRKSRSTRLKLKLKLLCCCCVIWLCLDKGADERKGLYVGEVESCSERSDKRIADQRNGKTR